MKRYLKLTKKQSMQNFVVNFRNNFHNNNNNNNNKRLSVKGESYFFEVKNMTKEEIKNIDIDAYKTRLEDSLWQDEVFALGINYGHTCIHYDKGEDINTVLNRMIKEDKQSVSNFSDKENALSLIQAAMVYDIDNVTNWIMKKESEFDSPKKYTQYVTNIDMREIVGGGIIHDTNTDTYSHKESNTIRIVLERSFSNDCCPYGFYLHTAYPSMAKDCTKEIEIFTKNDIISKNIYQFEDNYEKASYICNRMNSCIVSNNKDEMGAPYLKMYYADNDRAYKVFIQEDKTKICVKVHNENIYKKCNEVPEKLQEVINKAEEITGVQRNFSQKSFLENYKDAFKRAIRDNTNRQPVITDRNITENCK